MENNMGDNACGECGAALEMRECDTCGGDGAGVSNGFDDPRGECDGCDGEGEMPYCSECGEFRSEAAR